MVALLEPYNSGEEALAHHDVAQPNSQMIDLVVVQESQTVADLRDEI